MSIKKKFMYILFLKVVIDYNDTTILLASSDDPIKLYMNGLNIETIDRDKKVYLLKWLTLVEENLDDQERKDMEYAFMQNPETAFSYKIKDMELNIELINKF